MCGSLLQDVAAGLSSRIAWHDLGTDGPCVHLPSTVFSFPLFVELYMSIPARTLPKGADPSEGSYKINLRNILHMYTIGAVIVCFKPFFFCFIPKFPKDFKKLDQTLKFLNLGVLILETRKIITVSRILILSEVPAKGISRNGKRGG